MKVVPPGPLRIWNSPPQFGGLFANRPQADAGGGRGLGEAVPVILYGQDHPVGRDVQAGGDAGGPGMADDVGFGLLRRPVEQNLNGQRQIPLQRLQFERRLEALRKAARFPLPAQGLGEWQGLPIGWVQAVGNTAHLVKGFAGQAGDAVERSQHRRRRRYQPLRHDLQLQADGGQRLPHPGVQFPAQALALQVQQFNQLTAALGGVVRPARPGASGHCAGAGSGPPCWSAGATNPPGPARPAACRPRGRRR